MPLKVSNNLSYDFVAERLSYDPIAGMFRWKKNGLLAGTVTPSGRLAINLSGVPRLAHRLAFLLMTGEFPAGRVDHKDRDPLNNRWENLREASVYQNAQNTKIRVDNSSGAKGVSRCITTGKWRVLIYANGKRLDGGRFDDFSDAVAKRSDLALRLHGEFAS